jgi:hypothetical protein
VGLFLVAANSCGGYSTSKSARTKKCFGATLPLQSAPANFSGEEA